jgi:hypothetical protein
MILKDCFGGNFQRECRKISGILVLIAENDRLLFLDRMYPEGSQGFRREQPHPEAGLREPRHIVVQRIDAYMIFLTE